MPVDSPPRPPFRPQAEQRMQSPERLDALTNVTDAKGWIAIVVGSLGVVAGLVWGVLGSIPDRVEGPLVLVRSDQIVPVLSPIDGIVDDVAIDAGDSVTTGDTVASIVGSDGSSTEVAVPASGTVEQVFVQEGLPIGAATEIATILRDDPRPAFSGVAYVGPQDAVKLAAGQEVTVAPATVDTADAGRLLGRIAFVGDLPSRPDAITAQVQNEPLAQLLAAQASNVPYLVLVEFDTPLRWTNDEPPDFDPKDGTLSAFSVVVDRERPIDLVFGG